MTQATIDEINAYYKQCLAEGYSMAEAAEMTDEAFGLSEEREQSAGLRVPSTLSGHLTDHTNNDYSTDLRQTQWQRSRRSW
jgi:hypothetical protein